MAALLSNSAELHLALLNHVLKNAMYQKYLNVMISRCEYTTYKNKLTEIIKHKKSNYNNNFIISNKNNSQAEGQHIRCK